MTSSRLIIRELVISDFKNYKGQHAFVFKRKAGLYYVTGKNEVSPEMGPNGVGKSTLLVDGPLWVAFGKTEKDSRPSTAIIPWGSKKGTTGTLHMQRGDRRFSLVRTRKPNRLCVYAGEGDAGKEIAQADVPNLLGMTEELFRRTIVLGQSADMFFDLGADAQSQMFNDALQLDIWLAAADKASSSAKELQREQDNLNNELTALTATIASLSEEMAHAKQAAIVHDERHEENRAVMRSELLQASRLFKQAVRIEKPKEPDGTTERELQDDVNAVLSQCTARSNVVIRLTAERKALKEQLEELGDGTCPTCGTLVEDLPKSYRSLQNKLDEVTAQYEEAKVRTERKLAKLSRLKAELLEYQTQATAERDAWREAMQDYEENQKALRVLESAQARCVSKLEALEDAENTADADYIRLRGKRQAKRGAVVDTKQELVKVVHRLAEAKYWVQAFKEIRLGIIDETLTELEMATTRHAALLGLEDWAVKFNTERESKSGSVSYRFTVLLYPPGQEAPVKWESYSGGESQRWQLAVSFALSEVLLARAGVDVNIEVLDEPTKGLSPKGVDDLLEHLSDRARELDRAIYFVDHHSLDKGAFDGTLMVTNTKKGSQAQWLG